MESRLTEINNYQGKNLSPERAAQAKEKNGYIVSVGVRDYVVTSSKKGEDIRNGYSGGYHRVTTNYSISPLDKEGLEMSVEHINSGRGEISSLSINGKKSSNPEIHNDIKKLFLEIDPAYAEYTQDETKSRNEVLAQRNKEPEKFLDIFRKQLAGRDF